MTTSAKTALVLRSTQDFFCGVAMCLIGYSVSTMIVFDKSVVVPGSDEKIRLYLPTAIAAAGFLVIWMAFSGLFVLLWPGLNRFANAAKFALTLPVFFVITFFIWYYGSACHGLYVLDKEIRGKYDYFGFITWIQKTFMQRQSRECMNTIVFIMVLIVIGLIILKNAFRYLFLDVEEDMLIENREKRSMSVLVSNPLV